MRTASCRCSPAAGRNLARPAGGPPVEGGAPGVRRAEHPAQVLPGVDPEGGPLADGDRVPLALAVAGANAHGMRPAEPTLRGFAVRRPRPERGHASSTSAGKGAMSPPLSASSSGASARRCTSSGGARRCMSGETNPRYRARHWVVERSHSWMNRLRRLLVRWEKKAANCEAFLHLACAWVTSRRVGVRGWAPSAGADRAPGSGTPGGYRRGDARRAPGSRGPRTRPGRPPRRGS